LRAFSGCWKGHCDVVCDVTPLKGCWFHRSKYLDSRPPRGYSRVRVMPSHSRVNMARKLSDYTLRNTRLAKFSHEQMSEVIEAEVRHSAGLAQVSPSFSPTSHWPCWVILGPLSVGMLWASAQRRSDVVTFPCRPGCACHRAAPSSRRMAASASELAQDAPGRLSAWSSSYASAKIRAKKLCPILCPTCFNLRKTPRNG